MTHALTPGGGLIRLGNADRRMAVLALGTIEC